MNYEMIYKGRITDWRNFTGKTRWIIGNPVKFQNIYNLTKSDATGDEYTLMIPVRNQFFTYKDYFGVGLGFARWKRVESDTICKGLKRSKDYSDILWENDICEWTVPGFEICRGIICFGHYIQDENEYYGFFVKLINCTPIQGSGWEQDDYPEYLKECSLLKMLVFEDFKVIGNVFDDMI